MKFSPKIGTFVMAKLVTIMLFAKKMGCDISSFIASKIASKLPPRILYAVPMS